MSQRPGKVRLILAITVVVLLAGHGFAAENSATSKRISYLTYKEQVGRVTLIFSGQLATIDPELAYLPFQVAVGVRGKGPTLTITRASFVLIDGDGNVYPAAPLKEVVAQDKVAFFKAVDRANPLVIGNAFLDFDRAVLILYPQTAASVGKELVELTRETYFMDIVYFPRPRAGLGGVLTLQFMARGLAEPIQLRFELK